MGTLINIILLAVSLAIGVGVAMFLIPDLLPFLDEQTRIIIAVVLTIFSFVALYFISKGNSGG
ncbi:MAG: hypothetical protein ABH983_06095 [Candidatus Micrarchaeota archaeon]|nr:hypothetical protein [Candidatus Micrarchaeota archaeon]MBU1681447.1 hypothetical protein [Candidatus Micrarchaeota archaeon]